MLHQQTDEQHFVTFPLHSSLGCSLIPVYCTQLGHHRLAFFVFVVLSFLVLVLPDGFFHFALLLYRQYRQYLYLTDNTHCNESPEPVLSYLDFLLYCTALPSPAPDPQRHRLPRWMRTTTTRRVLHSKPSCPVSTSPRRHLCMSWATAV